MNDTRNRDKPASAMTKREKVAETVLAQLLRASTFMQVRQTDDGLDEVKPPSPDFQLVMRTLSDASVRLADALFDALEDMPELAHPYDEPDFDHEGTP